MCVCMRMFLFVHTMLTVYKRINDIVYERLKCKRQENNNDSRINYGHSNVSMKKKKIKRNALQREHFQQFSVQFSGLCTTNTNTNTHISMFQVCKREILIQTKC